MKNTVDFTHCQRSSFFMLATLLIGGLVVGAAGISILLGSGGLGYRVTAGGLACLLAASFIGLMALNLVGYPRLERKEHILTIHRAPWHSKNFDLSRLGTATFSGVQNGMRHIVFYEKSFEQSLMLAGQYVPPSLHTADKSFSTFMLIRLQRDEALGLINKINQGRQLPSGKQMPQSAHADEDTSRPAPPIPASTIDPTPERVLVGRRNKGYRVGLITVGVGTAFLNIVIFQSLNPIFLAFLVGFCALVAIEAAFETSPNARVRRNYWRFRRALFVIFLIGVGLLMLDRTG